MARYLVTGGCGFIGSHLCAALVRRGDDVTVLDDLSTGHRRKLAAGCRLVIGDAADPKTVAGAMAAADGVFHLAAIASVPRCNEMWMASHLANQTATVTVLEAARDLGKLPVVYASSAAVYGHAGDRAVAENCRPAPLTAYGVDKFGSELHASVATRLHGVPTVGLRLFNVYGPGQEASSPYAGAISVFADRIRRRESVEIFGDGRQVRDFIHVTDVVRFFLATMAQPIEDSLVFNVCTGRGSTLRDLVHTLGVIGEVTPVVQFGPERPGDIRFSLGDPSLASRVLGLSAATTLAQGLRSVMVG